MALSNYKILQLGDILKPKWIKRRKDHLLKGVRLNTITWQRFGVLRGKFAL